LDFKRQFLFVFLSTSTFIYKQSVITKSLIIVMKASLAITIQLPIALRHIPSAFNSDDSIKKEKSFGSTPLLALHFAPLPRQSIQASNPNHFGASSQYLVALILVCPPLTLVLFRTMLVVLFFYTPAIQLENDRQPLQRTVYHDNAFYSTTCLAQKETDPKAS
jgi:hypothetical protein